MESLLVCNPRLKVATRVSTPLAQPQPRLKVAIRDSTPLAQPQPRLKVAIRDSTPLAQPQSRLKVAIRVSRLWEPESGCTMWRRHAVAGGERAQEGGQVEGMQSRRICECHDQYDVLVPYVDAWQWQRSCVEAKVAMLGRGEDVGDTLVVLQHPPVYTLGTRSSEANLKFDVDDPPFELHRTERGGEVTYHGPGQLVMYPILNLRHHNMDMHWYLRTLEEVVIDALDMACGVQAHRIDGLTGVWVDNQKVAAIGVRVSRWITYHGLALNATTDLAPFSNIIPCGISDYSVTSVAKLLEQPSGSRQENAESLLKLLHDCLLTQFEEKFRLRLIPPSQPGPKSVSRTGVTPFL